MSIYCKQDGQWQRRIIDDGVEMGHVLWVGRFLGRPVLIVGSRAGRKELAIYRADESHRIGFRKEVIDEGVGATQMVVIDRGNNETWLFIAGHGRNEVLLYQITD